MDFEYLEYGSPEFLNAIWNDDSAIGVCGQCGGDDSPVLVTYQKDKMGRSWGEPIFMCKWCTEMGLLSAHRHLQRSLSKQKQVSTTRFNVKKAIVFAYFVVLVLYSIANLLWNVLT